MTTPYLPVLDPTAAAIDVGSEQLHVSVAGGPPKVFGTTTGQLHELRDWLKAQGVTSVAMEATGIYWLCPYEVLEQAGLVARSIEGRVHRFRLRRKPLQEAGGWIARHQAFWTGAVEQLDRLLSEVPSDDR